MQPLISLLHCSLLFLPLSTLLLLSRPVVSLWLLLLLLLHVVPALRLLALGEMACLSEMGGWLLLLLLVEVLEFLGVVQLVQSRLQEGSCETLGKVARAVLDYTRSAWD